jgi:hypothetical protein
MIPNVQILVAIIFFLVPSRQEDGQKIMDWATAKKLHWDVMILLGGGSQFYPILAPSVAMNFLDLLILNVGMLFGSRFFSFFRHCENWAGCLVRQPHGGSQISPLLSSHSGRCTLCEHHNGVCCQRCNSDSLSPHSSRGGYFNWATPTLAHDPGNFLLQLLLHSANCNTSECCRSFHWLHQTSGHDSTRLHYESCWCPFSGRAHSNSRYRPFAQNLKLFLSKK